MITIPDDFPVRPLKGHETAIARTTCNTCHLSWDDGIATQYTPAPGARCPFEYFHKDKETRKRGKSGISADYAYRLRESYLSKLRAIVSNVRFFKQTNEDLIDNVVKMREEKDFKRMPAHAKTYIEGYYAAMRDSIWNNDLMWVLSVDGKLMTSKEVDLLKAEEKRFGVISFKGEEYRTPWQRVDGNLSRYVWKDTKGNPILDKPFDKRFLSSPMIADPKDMLSDKELVGALKASPWEVAQQ